MQPRRTAPLSAKKTLPIERRYAQYFLLAFRARAEIRHSLEPHATKSSPSIFQGPAGELAGPTGAASVLPPVKLQGTTDRLSPSPKRRLRKTKGELVVLD
jgi:hypothetical protein